MSSLLELPEIRRHAYAVSVEAYHRLTDGQPTELLRGVIIEKAAKSPLHVSTIENLRGILSAQIKPGYSLRQYGPLTLSESEPEPDLAIVRGAPEDYFRAHPGGAELAIEVSISTLEIDRVKALIYAEASVPEYWILRPDVHKVEIYRNPAAGHYSKQSTLRPPSLLTSSALPGIQVDLGALFV